MIELKYRHKMILINTDEIVYIMGDPSGISDSCTNIVFLPAKAYLEVEQKFEDIVAVLNENFLVFKTTGCNDIAINVSYILRVVSDSDQFDDDEHQRTVISLVKDGVHLNVQGKYEDIKRRLSDIEFIKTVEKICES